MSVIEKSMKDIGVNGLVCLEAGTGAGNMTRYLVKNGAKLVYSISNNEEHLEYARKRLSDKEAERVKFIKADLCNLSIIPSETVDLVTAHMLINVVPPTEILLIFRELTRVTKINGLIVINDYNPLSSYMGKRSYLVEELFKIENALNYLIESKPALVWYPAEYIIQLLKLLGWVLEDMELVYKKTPWEKDLLKEHVEVIEGLCTKVNNERIKNTFLQQTLEIFNKVKDDEVIYAGSIYSVRMQKKLDKMLKKTK
ncbi:MAG: class I SAM-dependent methyltransferase [candidate division WOR-3 bacterium]